MERTGRSHWVRDGAGSGSVSTSVDPQQAGEGEWRHIFFRFFPFLAQVPSACLPYLFLDFNWVTFAGDLFFSKCECSPSAVPEQRLLSLQQDVSTLKKRLGHHERAPPGAIFPALCDSR